MKDKGENKVEIDVYKRQADATVRNIMRLGRDGMKETDIEILHMMIGQ